MKNLRNTALMVLLSAGCICAQNITVQGEKKLNTDFKKYKTFGWMQSGQNAGNQVVAYTYEEIIDPTASNPTIDKNASTKQERKQDKKMVKAEKKAFRKNKELVIYSYSFIIPSTDSTINNAAMNSVDDELEGRGYRKDQASPDLLVAYKIFDGPAQIKGYNSDQPVVAGNTELRQPQDTITYALKPGSVLITLIDSKTSAVVWEGYASGVAKSNDMINDPLKVKEAINLIFKKYEFRADKYSMNN